MNIKPLLATLLLTVSPLLMHTASAENAPVMLTEQDGGKLITIAPGQEVDFNFSGSYSQGPTVGNQPSIVFDHSGFINSVQKGSSTTFGFTGGAPGTALLIFLEASTDSTKALQSALIFPVQVVDPTSN